MNRPLLPGLALAAGIALTACSEPSQDSSLQGPSTVASLLAKCNPNSFPSLISGYFNPPKQQEVTGQKDLMLAELNENPADFTQARVHGFNILREIAARSKAPSPPSASTGSALAVEVLECTFNVDDTINVIEQVPDAAFFIEELDRANGGTFEVRGGEGDPTGQVQAAVGGIVIAGIAPPKDFTWSNALNGERVLIYGDPASSSPTDYHFSTVPFVAYDPPLLVTTCVASEDASLMMTESNVGVLAFVNDGTNFGCGQSIAAGPAGRFNLLQHLAALILPEPAAAASAVAATAVIGGAKGRSLFDVDQVINLVVSHSTVPSPIGKVVVNKLAIQSLTVTVTEDGDLVNGARIEVSLETNNGTFNGVRLFSNGTCSGTVPSLVTGTGSFPNGTVIFPPVCIIKEGAGKVVMTAKVDGRIGQGVGKTAKFTVSPK